MIRENKFLDNTPNCSAHRQLSAKKVKEIFIQNIANNNDTKPLKIGMNKTVKDLKKEIEKLFGLNYSLDEYALRVKTNGMTAGKLIHEADESKTLLENSFTTQCKVIFGKEKNRGGFQNILNLY
jgi:hypothetical protein